MKKGPFTTLQDFPDGGAACGCIVCLVDYLGVKWFKEMDYENAPSELIEEDRVICSSSRILL